MTHLNVCQTCRGCCNKVNIPVQKESVAGKLLLEKWQNGEMPKGHELYDNEEDRPGNWKYDSNGAPCLFLNQETYECTIHNDKPLVCRMYPLVWQNEKNYFIDLCPLAFVVPLKDIYAWKDGNEEAIGDFRYFINSYHNGEKTRDMVPISRLLHEKDHLKAVFEEV